MRIAVSKELCTGQGRCYVISPDLFTSDTEGFNAERGTEFDVPSGFEKEARLAADTCPEGAISVIEG